MLRMLTIVIASIPPTTLNDGPAMTPPQPTARSIATEGAGRSRTGNEASSSGEEVTTARRHLTVWTSSHCLGCRLFWCDLNTDGEFRAALQTRFHVQWVDFDTHRAAAADCGIFSVPTFELGDHRISGYRGKRWLWSSLIADATGVPVSSNSQTETVRDREQAAGDATLPPLPPLSRPRSRAVPEPGASNLASRSPLTSAAPERSSQGQQVSPVASQSLLWRSLWARVSDGIYRSAPLVFTGLEAAGIVAGTAATGGFGTIAVAAIWNVWKRRRSRRLPAAGITPHGDVASRGEEEGPGPGRAPFPRRLDEARQLLALRQSEGRVATLDALRGMFLDDELNKLMSSANEVDAALATRLKAAIDNRVDEVAPLSISID